MPKKKTGRPTKYKPEYCDQVIKFASGSHYDEKELKHFGKNGELKWVDIKRFPRALPTLVQFAKKIGVGLSTLYDWLNPKHASFQKEFSAIVTHVFKPLQKDWLIQATLQGLYHPGFAVFVAKNITDMRDKQEQEVVVTHKRSTPEEEALADEYLDKYHKIQTAQIQEGGELKH